jgi:DNA-binding transcriptional MerR regulator
MTIKEVSARYGVSADALRYYERVGVLPAVNRTAGGIRDYTESDLAAVQFALCMRSAGLSVEALVEYQRLFREGDATIPARLQLLSEQREILLENKKNIETTLERLNRKIGRYEEAVKTGKLVWDSPAQSAEKPQEEELSQQT